jgi:hypothetical protein
MCKMGIFCGRGKIGYLAGRGVPSRLRSPRRLEAWKRLAVKDGSAVVRAV